MTEASKPAGISRRTLVKGAAWSVPVVAIGPALPAFAATPGIFQLTGQACKLPGNALNFYKGYAFGVTATNPFNVSIDITINSLTLAGSDLGDVLIVQTDPTTSGICIAYTTNTITIPATQTLFNLVVLTEGAGNSQNGALTVNYTVDGGTSGSFTNTETVDASPPLQGNSCDDFTQAQKDCVLGLNV